jgi:hypothetical protein
MVELSAIRDLVAIFTGERAQPIKRKNADRYFRLNLLSFAASVTLTRIILEATGYPQLGGETLHIAHVLYGGVLLYVGSLLPLIYANRWAYTWSSVLTGVGIGLFIDEVGKFITQSNDYFFPAAAPIIYAFFLTSVLIYTRVRKGTPQGTREEFFAVLESLGSAIDNEMDPEEHGELIERLQRLEAEEANTDLGLLSRQLLGYVDSEAVKIASHEPKITHKARNWWDDFEDRWLNQKNVKLFVTLGLLVFGLAGSVRLVYYTTGGPETFESLLRARVANLPMDTNASLSWAGAQLVIEGLVGMTMLFSTALFIYGMDGVGLELGSLAMLVYLVGVNLIQFYIDQMSTVAKALIQFLFLQAMYYYQRRFHTCAEG